MMYCDIKTAIKGYADIKYVLFSPTKVQQKTIITIIATRENNITLLIDNMLFQIVLKAGNLKLYLIPKRDKKSKIVHGIKPATKEVKIVHTGSLYSKQRKLQLNPPFKYAK